MTFDEDATRRRLIAEGIEFRPLLEVANERERLRTPRDENDKIGRRWCKLMTNSPIRHTLADLSEDAGCSRRDTPVVGAYQETFFSRSRRFAFEMLERDVAGSRMNIIVNGLIVVLIIGSVLSIIFESNAAIAAAYYTFFWNFEVFCVAIFTIEYITRIWSAVENPRFQGMAAWQARLRYLVTPLAVIDFISIAPFYLHLFVPMDLRFVRFLRLLRLFKLSHYFRSLSIFVDVLRSEGRTLFSVIFTVFVLIIVTACVMYLVEHTAQPEAFGDVPQAIWWAVVTMTTVGYGDVMPVTGLGKIIAVFVMLLGVGLVALPAAMLAAKFAEELRTRTRALERKVDEYLADGLFDENERQKIKELSDRLGLSEAAVSQLTERRQLELTCPHCGKPFFKTVTTNDK